MFDEDVKIHNFDFEAGLQYDYKLSNTASILFTLGYKYEAHYQVLNTYGQSLLIDEEQRTPGPNSGNRNNNFISYGPFARVGFKF